MTTTPSAPVDGSRRPVRWALALELLGAVVALPAVGWLALSGLAVGLAFFGEQSRFDAAEVRTYWTTLVVLGLASLVALVGAVARGARLSLAWHLAVALLGLAVALVLPVSEVGPARYPLVDGWSGTGAPAQHEQGPVGPVCHSGGDSAECPGG